MCSRRTLANDQLGSEQDLALPAPAADTVEKHPGRTRAVLVLVHPYGCERRREQAGEHYVVASNHRDVVGDTQAKLGTGPHRPNGDEVVVADEPVDAGALREHPPALVYDADGVVVLGPVDPCCAGLSLTYTGDLVEAGRRRSDKGPLSVFGASTPGALPALFVGPATTMRLPYEQAALQAASQHVSFSASH